MACDMLRAQKTVRCTFRSCFYFVKRVTTDFKVCVVIEIFTNRFIKQEVSAFVV